MRVWRAITALVVCSACGGVPDTPESLLERSFAQQIAGVGGVDHFEWVASEMTFTHPNADGDVVEWRVVLDSSTVHRGESGTEPERGDVVSTWYADGILVEPIGSISRLPDAFLETGVAQECYALWDQDAGVWGW
ncbi:MAG: hypothetical protein ACJ0H0_03480 [Vicinamibacterales bacterium]